MHDGYEIPEEPLEDIVSRALSIWRQQDSDNLSRQLFGSKHTASVWSAVAGRETNEEFWGSTICDETARSPTIVYPLIRKLVRLDLVAELPKSSEYRSRLFVKSQHELWTPLGRLCTMVNGYADGRTYLED